MKGCNRQFYYGTDQYPDHRCIDGNLWDDDNCDEKGNLYKPEESIACPYCRPEEYEEEALLKTMKGIEYENTKAREIEWKLKDKGW